MSKGYQIYYDDKPITVPIVDEKRAALGYNLLNAMAQSRSIVLGDDKDVLMDERKLRMADENGRNVGVKPDPEWFGTEEENQQIKDAVLDQYMEAAAFDGVKLDREFEAELQEPYLICSYNDDHISVRFSPEVWDIDKAGEMQNFMRYGLDPSVQLSMKTELFDVKSLDAITADHTYIINMDGDVYQDAYNENWAAEKMPETVSLSDALDSLQAADNHLEL